MPLLCNIISCIIIPVCDNYYIEIVFLYYSVAMFVTKMFKEKIPTDEINFITELHNQ